MHASGANLDLCPAGFYFFLLSLFLLLVLCFIFYYNTDGPACRLSPFSVNLDRLTEKVRTSHPSCSRCDAGRLAGWLALAGCTDVRL